MSHRLLTLCSTGTQTIGIVRAASDGSTSSVAKAASPTKRPSLDATVNNATFNTKHVHQQGGTPGGALSGNNSGNLLPDEDSDESVYEDESSDDEDEAQPDGDDDGNGAEDNSMENKSKEGDPEEPSGEDDE